MTDTDTDTVKPARTRSPNYPAFDLGEATVKAKTLYDKYRVHLVPLETALKMLGYTAKSSSGWKAIAALKAYGLVDAESKEGKRNIKISENGAMISGGHRDREYLLQEAALQPALHRELWDSFFTKDGGLAPDDLIRHYLIWDRKDGTFNEQVVDGFIEQFNQTILFAKLDSVYIISKEAEKDEENNSFGDEEKPHLPLTPPLPKVEIGMKQEITTIGKTQATITWPAILTSPQFDDLEYWLQGVLRKAKRDIGTEPPASDDPAQPNED